jgi:hypothetical protein
VQIFSKLFCFSAYVFNLDVLLLKICMYCGKATHTSQNEKFVFRYEIIILSAVYVNNILSKSLLDPYLTSYTNLLYKEIVKFYVNGSLYALNTW